MTDKQFDELLNAADGYTLVDDIYADLRAAQRHMESALRKAHEARRDGAIKRDAVVILENQLEMPLMMLDRAARDFERIMREQPHETEERD